MSLTWSLLAVPLLIALNAFFVAGEYAVVALRPPQIEAMRARGHTTAATAMRRLKDEPASAIGAIQVCITMTNLLLGWIGEPAMSAVLHRLFGPLIQLSPSVMTIVATALSFLLVTLLTVVLSELLPKALTLRYVETVAILTAVPILLVRRAIWPLVWLMNTMADAVTRPLGLGSVSDDDEHQVTVEELMAMARQAADQGSLSSRERSLVLNSLVIGERKARQIMVPRVKVTYLDLKRSMEDNVRLMNEHLYTRLPLCEGNMDSVVGVVPTKEFLSAYKAEGDVSVLSLLAQPPVFAPDGIPLDRLLGVFHEHKTQLVFLADEHGGVEGIVTLQDVVDELFGQISEAREHLHDPRHPTPTKANAKHVDLIVPGDAPLHDVARRINRPDWNPDVSASTVGGAVIEHLGRIPSSGEVANLNGVHLRVIESDGRTVRWVQVQCSEPTMA